MRLRGFDSVQSSLILLGLLALICIAQPIEESPGQRPHQHDERSISLSRSPSPFRDLPAGFSHGLSDDWIVDLHTFYTLLPWETAASTLQTFYEDVAYLAATTLTSTATRYLIRMGKIDLEVRSQLGDIPWTVVMRFANMMRDLVKRGFTNTYQINFVDRITGKLITMSLWVGTVRWG